MIRAYAQVNQPPGDARVVRAFLDGAVDPQWRGRGIGRQVLAWEEARGRQLLAASGKELPARLAVVHRRRAEATDRLLSRRRFTPVRYYAEMRRPLDMALPPVEAPDGLRIVPWSAELDEPVRLAHNEAFADHWGSEPRTAQEWAQGRSMFAPTWSFAAVDDASGRGRRVPDVGAGSSTTGPCTGYSAGYTDLLGVRRAWRGRGSRAPCSSRRCRRTGPTASTYAELAVDTANQSGAHRLYEGLGYVVYQRATMFSIEL